jgi:peroxiredoxin
MVRRAIFVIDEQGVIRHRKVTLAGLTYESVDDLEQALASIA